MGKVSGHSLLVYLQKLLLFLRRILLDSILLPFLLLSILFATNSKHKIDVQATDGRESRYPAGSKRNEEKEINKTDFLLVLLSGIFLGLAVFTKIPSISMVPLIGYMIFTGSKKNWKSLGLWLIPVMLIPTIWPFYSLMSNEFTNWTNDVLWQGGREGSGNRSLYSIFNMDPILTLLGVAGLIFAIIKRDFLPILWIIPFMFFIEFIGFTQNFYWVMVLPAFCIAGAVMIVAALKKIGKTLTTRMKPHQKPIERYELDDSSPRQEHDGFKRIYEFFMKIPPHLLSYRTTYVITIIGLGVFGLTSTTMITKPFLNSTLFELYTFIVQNLPDNGVAISTVNSTDNRVTIIGDKRWLAEFLWVPRYVLDKDLEFRGNFRTVPLSLKEPVETEKVLLIVDSNLRDDITKDSDEEHIQQLQMIYVNTTSIGTFEDSEEYETVRSHRNMYPFTSMEDNRGTGKIEVRSNY